MEESASDVCTTSQDTDCEGKDVSDSGIEVTTPEKEKSQPVMADTPENETKTPGTSEDHLMEDLFPDGITRLDGHMVESLTLGVLSNLLPEMQKAKSTLVELTENQRILIETIQQKNAMFTDSDALKEVTAIMEKAKTYHGKLINIKKDMLTLHEKSARLKKRALKLQQQKQKEALQREQNRERELERERRLIAKPAKKSSSSVT